MKLFENTGADLNEVLQITNDAWNYFSHKTLNGKSPFEIANN